MDVIKLQRGSSTYQFNTDWLASVTLDEAIAHLSKTPQDIVTKVWKQVDKKKPKPKKGTKSKPKEKAKK